MSPMDELLARLKEDRLDAERARRQARIQQAFDAARTVERRERRRYARPGEINPALYGRRKDDKPLVVDAVVQRFKQMIADAADPEVELVVEPEPLSKQAAGLLAAIGGDAVARKKDVKCHEINETYTGDINKLFEAAEASLFESDADRLKLNMASPKQSLWTRPLRIRKEKP
jgi:hypothetical protein